MELDDALYRLKPMNCPFHILIYKNIAIITALSGENGRYGVPGDPRAFDLTTGKQFTLPENIVSELRKLKSSTEEKDYTEKLLKDSDVKYNIQLTEEPPPLPAGNNLPASQNGVDGSPASQAPSGAMHQTQPTPGQ